MKKIIATTLLLATTLINANTNIFKKLNLQCDQIINKEKINMQICYSYKYKGPLAVIYKLNGNLVNKTNIKKRPRFYAEKAIPKAYRVKPGDYTYATSSLNYNIKFDRGHLAPDADFDYNYKALLKVYTMANIVPQEKYLNEKTWIKAEKYERLMATKLHNILVINLVKYNNINNILVKQPLSVAMGNKNWSLNKIRKYKKQAEKLKEKHIVIPSSFVKIIINKDFKKCLEYKNIQTNWKEDKLKNHLINCEF